jgi:hypothetical protein
MVEYGPGMVSWEQDFDFYMAMIEDLPASFVIDLTAAQHAPVESHPLLLSIRVPMQLRREDGLRDARELEALGALEDHFVTTLEEKVDAIYIGRVVHDGTTTMFLYVPAAHRAALEDLPSVTGAPADPYLPKWAVADDPTWDHYLGFMAPDDYAMQTIWNRRLIAIFEEKGDALDAEREVDHMVYFPTRENAEAAGAALREAGFKTDELEPPAKAEGSDEERGWGLQFHRDDALSDGRPDDFVAEVFAIIQPFVGDYDGWGATPVKQAADA